MVKSRHCRHNEQDHKPIAPFADTINRSHTPSSDMAPTPDPPIHEGHTASSSTGTVLRLRRRRRPRISIAAIFLRFSRACCVRRRPARGHHSNGDSEPSVEDGNLARADEPVGDQESNEHCCSESDTPITTPPRYADILDARRLMIEKESKILFPQFIKRQTVPSPCVFSSPTQQSGCKSRSSIHQRIKKWRDAAQCVQNF